MESDTERLTAEAAFLACNKSGEVIRDRFVRTDLRTVDNPHRQRAAGLLSWGRRTG